MASSSKSEVKVPDWFKKRDTIKMEELCCDGERSTKTCVWAINNGTEGDSVDPPFGRSYSRCRHPIVENCGFCDSSSSDSTSSCYQIREVIIGMMVDLELTKKFLKNLEFYEWAVKQAEEKKDDEKVLSAKTILDQLQDGHGQIPAMLLVLKTVKYKKYFDKNSQNTEVQGFKQLKEYLEGKDSEKEDEFPGEIAKTLNQMLKEQRKGKKLPIDFGRWTRDVCHEHYCASIPCSQLSADAKIDLVSKIPTSDIFPGHRELLIESVPGIKWALQEPKP